MIRLLNEDDYSKCYNLIHETFLLLAESLGITPSNCPGHSAYLTYQKFLGQINKNLSMYGLFEPDLIGCVGLVKKSDVRYQVKYLTVDQAHRHKGHGKMLMDYIEDLSFGKIQLGMIYEDQTLYEWYQNLGYKVDKLTYYKKNKFQVAYMEKVLDENI